MATTGKGAHPLDGTARTFDARGSDQRRHGCMPQLSGVKATVAWNDGHPTLTSLPYAISLNTGPQVVKADPHIPMAEASLLVTAGFKRCAAPGWREAHRGPPPGGTTLHTPDCGDAICLNPLAD